MSAVRFITIDCDAPDCTEAYDSGTTSVQIARRWASANGWRCRRAPGRLIDLCPEHLESPAPALPAE